MAKKARKARRPRAKLLRTKAHRIHAGDTIAVKEEGGSRRILRHVCETRRNGNNMHIIYNSDKGFEHINCTTRDPFVVQRWV